MALGASQTSNFVEGSDRTRRWALTGDNAYPNSGTASSGYDVLTALRTLSGNGGLLIKRVISFRHKTLASALVGTPVFVDTYSGGSLSALTMPVIAAAGTELANGANASNLSIELITEGY